MKKFVSPLFMFIFILFLMTFYKVSAQSFSEGQGSLSAGYGFDVWFGSVLYEYSDRSTVESRYTGPLYFKFEKAVSSKIGLGLNVAYGKYYFDYNYSYSGSSNIYHGQDIYTTYSVLFRFNYHFGNFEKVDPYWGLGTGYRYGHLIYNENGPSGGNIYNIVNTLFPLGFETTFGIRTYLGQQIALYVEAGAAKSTVQFGVTYKF